MAIHRRKPDQDYELKLDGRAEAHLVALACSEPPEGRTRWTYALLADRLVTLEEIEFDSISEETVRQRLKNDLKPHRSEYWLIPPKKNAEFVYRMETILALYKEPYDETRPVICFDESSKELRKHVRDPLPAKPGAVAREDHHYERTGTRMLHVASEPLTGWCHIDVTERRRTCEWIDCMQAIDDDHYPDAGRIRVVLDNLSTHNPAAFYRFFPPKKARDYLDRFEFYYTPTHGSWLNMAELVWSSLQTQCLKRRISDAATLRSEFAAWETARNEKDVTVD